MGSVKWPGLVSWVPLVAGCYLLSGVNLYQAQNSTQSKVTDLHVIKVTALIEILDFSKFWKKRKLTNPFIYNLLFYMYTIIK